MISIFFLLFAGSTPIGGYITGSLGEHIGVRAGLLLMASVCAAGVVLAAGYYARVARGAFRALDLGEPPAGAARPELRAALAAGGR